MQWKGSHRTDQKSYPNERFTAVDNIDEKLSEELSAHSRFFPLRSIWPRKECLVLARHSPASHPDAQAKPADIVLNAHFTRFADNTSKATKMSSPTLARIPVQMNFSASLVRSEQCVHSHSVQ